MHKNTISILFLFLLFCFFSNNNLIKAQCPVGQTEITIDIVTVGFGSEVGWELIDATTNTVIACQPSGTYVSNATVTEGPFCITDGNNIQLIGYDTFGDDWNGGYAVITITEDGSTNGCSAQDGCVIFPTAGENLDIEPDVSVSTSCEGTTNEEFIINFPVIVCDNTIISGCTDLAGSNYNSCATVDDGSCLIPAVNDECVDALLVCDVPLSASTILATTVGSDPLTTCIGSLENTVWFNFIADPSGNPITIDITESVGCTGLQTHILSGDCTTGFVEEDCTDTDVGGVYTLTLASPIPGTTYYIYIDGIAGAECPITLQGSGGIQPCCGPDYTLTPTCTLGNETEFFIDIMVTNIGDNPSGYQVNGGAFPNITSTGTFTIGPFPNGTTTITFVGLDDSTCVLNVDITHDCSCDPAAVNAPADQLLCVGDPFVLNATLGNIFPGGFIDYTVTTSPAGSCTATPNGTPVIETIGDDAFVGPITLPFPFDFFGTTYNDFYIGSNGFVSFGAGSTSLGNGPIPSTATPNDIIALYWDDLNPGASGIVSHYTATVGGQACYVVEFANVEHFGGGETVTGQIIMCADGTVTINCIDCQADGGNGNGSATQGIEDAGGLTGYFDPALTNGETANDLMNCVTFTPNVMPATPCTFVHWLDSNGNVVSTNNGTVIMPTMSGTYTAVVDCQGLLCQDEVALTIDPCGACVAEVVSTGSVSQGGLGGISPFYFNVYEIEITNFSAPYSLIWNTIGYVRHSVVSYDGNTIVIRIFYADNATWEVSLNYGTNELCNTDVNGNLLLFGNNNPFAGNVLDIDNYAVTPDNGLCTQGAINIFPSGGDLSCGNYTYNWAGPMGYTATTQNISGICSGWYQVTVTDCIGDQTYGWYWVPVMVPGRGKVDGITVDAVRVYPNPLDSEANINFSVAESGKTTLNLYNVSGQKITTLFNGVAESGHLQTIPFSAEPLPAGIYLLQMTTANGEVTYDKIVINK